MFKERPPLLDHLECRTQAFCAALNLCQRQMESNKGASSLNGTSEGKTIVNLAIADEYDDSEQGKTYRLAKLLGLGHLESSESHQGISRVGVLRTPEAIDHHIVSNYKTSK